MGTNGDASNATLAMLSALASVGATSCRTNLYPGAYLKGGTDWNTPTPESLDSFMSAALQYGVTPMVLFEYYAPQFLNSTGGFGSAGQWAAIGAAFAAYLGPNGTWARRVGAPASFGVTSFSAMNEPDLGAGFIPGGTPGAPAYAAALGGLARGVKSVSPLSTVFPGGFASVNAYGDCTLRGLAAHLAPLWSDGTLDGVDLHTYYDVEYAPMEGTFAHSAQANYDCLLAAAGVSRALAFATTEYNYKERLVNDSVAARGLLTGVWDQLGLSSLPPASAPQTLRAFVWNAFDTLASDADYGLAASPPTLDAYAPTQRGCAWALVAAILQLAGAQQGWQWDSADPRGSGTFRLSLSPSSGDADSAALLVVWQARPAWTNASDLHSFAIADLPAGAAQVSVFAWDGLREVLPISPPGASSVTIADLPGDETYMFLVQAEGGAAPAGKVYAACFG